MNNAILDLMADAATPEMERQTALSRGRLFHQEETPRRIQARLISANIDAARKLSGPPKGPLVQTDPPRRRPVGCPLIAQHLTQTSPYHDTEQTP